MVLPGEHRGVRILTESGEERMSAVVDCLVRGADLLHGGKWNEFLKMATYDPKLGQPLGETVADGQGVGLESGSQSPVEDGTYDLVGSDVEDDEEESDEDGYESSFIDDGDASPERPRRREAPAARTPSPAPRRVNYAGASRSRAIMVSDDEDSDGLEILPPRDNTQGLSPDVEELYPEEDGEDQIRWSDIDE